MNTLEHVEREHFLRALNNCNWVIGGAAGAAIALGMKRTSLQLKMMKLGITRKSPPAGGYNYNYKESSVILTRLLRWALRLVGCPVVAVEVSLSAVLDTTIS